MASTARPLRAGGRGAPEPAPVSERPAGARFKELGYESWSAPASQELVFASAQLRDQHPSTATGSGPSYPMNYPINYPINYPMDVLHRRHPTP